MEPESATAAVAGAGASGAKAIEERDEVVIRFAGDSGDGMQLAGQHFTNETALAGNDLSTLPDFPAEIRAPAGTLAGVSGFQLHFSSRDVFTPGDAPDVLVAMNPAALKVNIGDLQANGILIVDKEQFNEQNLKKAEYASNPLTDDSLTRFQVFEVDITKLTINALNDLGLPTRTMMRSRNFFALGLTSWLFQRPIEPTIKWIEAKFKKNATVGDANTRVLKAGWNFGETAEMFRTAYKVAPATIAPGRYRNITGNQAAALGFVAAARCAGRPLFLGSYPITPASDILHELATYKNFNVLTFQAEDEIAGVGAALGAAFGGAIALTSTSGPGVCLKSEAINLAVMTELPLVIIDVQRGGPSTGLPTKTEQADLLQAMFGRNGESPVPIVAPLSPADCFDAAIEATRIALKYRTPVLLLSDGAIANGSEPWLIPDVGPLPDLRVEFATEPNSDNDSGEFWPYVRDPETLARAWAIPGTPGLQHRIGGLEKADRTGHISYDPDNHDKMVRTRQAKIDGIDVPDVVVDDPSGGKARVLALGWGSSFGPIGAACRRVRKLGMPIAQAHLRHLNPFPANLGDILRSYDKVVVPEMNLGQLSLLLRAKYLVDVHSHTKVAGMAFKAEELQNLFSEIITGVTTEAAR